MGTLALVQMQPGRRHSISNDVEATRTMVPTNSIGCAHAGATDLLAVYGESFTDDMSVLNAIQSKLDCPAGASGT